MSKNVLKSISVAAPLVAALGYLGTWFSASVFGVGVSVSPVGNSNWGTFWFIAALVSAAVATLDHSAAKLVSVAAAIGSTVFTVNAIYGYYSLPSLDRALVSLGWGAYLAIIGTIAWVAAAVTGATESLQA